MRVLLPLLVALGVSSPALAGLNDPFGPEMACFAGLKRTLGAESLQASRARGATAKSIPVSVLDTEGPSFALESLSKDGKSTHLRLFTESGEFDADFVLPTTIDSLCIQGVGFPAGPGSALYSNVKIEEEKRRFGSLTNYRRDICTDGHPRGAPVQAHQVGESGQAASRALLHSELGLMIGNVHAAWQQRGVYASRARSRAFRRLSSHPSAPFDQAKFTDETKAALAKCIDVLKGDSLKSLHAAAERELALFDRKPVEAHAADPTANPTK